MRWHSVWMGLLPTYLNATRWLAIESSNRLKWKMQQEGLPNQTFPSPEIS